MVSFSIKIDGSFEIGATVTTLASAAAAFFPLAGFD